MLLLLVVVGFCLWMVLPQAIPQNQGIEPTPSPSTGEAAALSAVPTPDLQAIQPSGAPTATATATAGGPAATPAPSDAATADPLAIALDLWLDASPNVAGITALNNGESGDKFKPVYGNNNLYKEILTGGFLYQVSGEQQGKNLPLTAQTGWYASLLNCLWSSEVVDQSGRVRVLRYAEDAILPDEALAPIVQSSGLTAAALRREAMTYAIYEDRVPRQADFFLRLLGSESKPFFESVKKVTAAKNFFTPGILENNQLLTTSEGLAPTPVEVQEAADRTALSDAYNGALATASARLATAEGEAAPATAITALSGDYFLYALQNLDPRHLNVLTLDTLGLPEIDPATAERYSAALQNLKDSQPDLAIGTVVCRLDYAGLVTGIAGHTLQCGLDWGFVARKFTDNGKNATLTFAFTLPMPRPLTVLVVGPGASVDAYMDRLNAKLAAELQEANPNNNNYAGVLSGERGDVRETKGYTSQPAYMYMNTPTGPSKFTFAYRATVMHALDVGQQQSALAAGILAHAAPDLGFTVDGNSLHGGVFEWSAQQGAQTVKTNVPIVTADFSAPIAVAVDVSAKENETGLPTLALENLAVRAHIDAGLAMSILDLEKLQPDSLPAENNQAYVDPADNQRLYIYGAAAPGDAPALAATQVSLAGGKLSFALTADAKPKPGYYWVSLAMEYNTDPQADEPLWNPIPDWAAANKALLQADDPAAFPAEGTWDYTPGDMSGQWLNVDNALTKAKPSDIKVGNGGAHAWGVGATLAGKLLPASVPPVFRAFQLNTLMTALRAGLFTRPEKGAASRVLTRQLILYVPMAD